MPNPHEREIIIAMWKEGWTYGEIAEAVHYSDKTIQREIKKARAK